MGLVIIAKTNYMAEEKVKLSNKEEVQKVIESFFAALSSHDIKRMMSHYAPDVVIFDVKLPFQNKGAITLKHTWEAALPFFPKVFGVEIRDLSIHASDTVALSHFLFRFTGEEKDHPAMQTWMRATGGYKKQQGKWKIVHEHCSLPFNPHTSQVVFTLEL
jgi:ketosteroid isomerase-like protein